MPSVAEEPPVILPGKKRRRDGDLEASQYRRYYPAGPDIAFGPSPDGSLFAALVNNDRLIFHANHDAEFDLRSVARNILPLPAAKRVRILDDQDAYAYAREPSPPVDARRRDRGSRSPASQRPVLRDHEANGAARPSQPPRPNSAPPLVLLLSPCRVCHRRPTKKSDLDSFAACEGCGQRTCFVCLRECPGWVPGRPAGEDEDEDEDVLSEQEALSRSFHMDDVDAGDQRPPEASGRHAGAESGWTSGGHRQVVCSRCCIERGSEGDVVCLGCLSRMEGVSFLACFFPFAGRNQKTA